MFEQPPPPKDAEQSRPTNTQRSRLSTTIELLAVQHQPGLPLFKLEWAASQAALLQQRNGPYYPVKLHERVAVFGTQQTVSVNLVLKWQISNRMQIKTTPGRTIDPEMKNAWHRVGSPSEDLSLNFSGHVKMFVLCVREKKALSVYIPISSADSPLNRDLPNQDPIPGPPFHPTILEPLQDLITGPGYCEVGPDPITQSSHVRSISNARRGPPRWLAIIMQHRGEQHSPDSETEGLPADLSEFLELAVELVDEAVPSEHSETLRRLERRAAAAAAPGPQEEPVGALELSPWRPCRPCKPCRPVWFISCSSLLKLRGCCDSIGWVLMHELFLGSGVRIGEVLWVLGFGKTYERLIKVSEGFWIAYEDQLELVF
ncbi:hypothetical protein WN48_08584 [Eufriesea mexicana]|nr:hypothetical protein WN48_08584 [Eufriesea mexicana]